MEERDNRHMICPKCGAEQDDGNRECTRCGVIFAKIRADAPPRAGSLAGEETLGSLPAGRWIRDLFFSVKPGSDLFSLAGRSLLLVILTLWGVKFFSHPVADAYAGESFLHLVNLPFHEAGHLFFRPFGEFTTALGGSLGQLIMPLICLLTFLVKMRDPFAASVAFWWFGQNFMDMAPYIDDARDLNLILLGGYTGKDSPGIHDWEYLLGRLNLLSYDHALAGFANGLGMACMVTACAWGGYVLYKGFRSSAEAPDIE